MVEEPLRGGRLSSVVRVGDTVRRRTGPWTPAVHSLLSYLEDVGFDAAPRVLGIDEHGREVLTFIPGETVGEPPWPEWIWSDAVLKKTAGLLRQYHDAVANYRPPDDSVWRFRDGSPGPREIVCHNDVGPPNIVIFDGVPAALIDWDWAEPAEPMWDLGHAAWLGVPLLPPAACEELGLKNVSLSWQTERLELLCDAYGVTTSTAVVQATLRRIEASIARIASGSSSDVALSNLRPSVRRMRATLDYIRHHRGPLTGTA